MANRLFKKPEIPAFNAHRAITASATRLNLRDRKQTEEIRAQRLHQAWQPDAWDYSDKIGEIKFAFGLVASVLSRLRLYPAAVVDPESPPVPLADAITIERPESEEKADQISKSKPGIDPDLALKARDLMAKALARTSVPNLMRSCGLNLSIPGECYLVLDEQEWKAYSTSELDVDASGEMQLRRLPGQTPDRLDKDTTTVGRIWRPHGRWSRLADSSMRGVIDDCAELVLLGQMIRATGRSQLNAGILYVADTLEVVGRPITDDAEEESEAEADFGKELVYSITEPVRDENAGNTVVPLLVRGPAQDAKDMIFHIDISRKSDEYLVNRADRTLERVLQGLDVPKDIVTGLANIKYSNAIQIDESLYKAHVEPLALTICDALTEICLRPLLKASGEFEEEDINKIVVWYDPSEVVTRPDRAADSRELYDRKELSGAAMRNAHSFGEADKPDEEELARRLAIEASVPPEAVSALLAWLLPKVLKGDGAAGAEMPDDLSALLRGTEMPEPIDLPPTEAGMPPELNTEQAPVNGIAPEEASAG